MVNLLLKSEFGWLLGAGVVYLCSLGVEHGVPPVQIVCFAIMIPAALLTVFAFVVGGVLNWIDIFDRRAERRRAERRRR